MNIYFLVILTILLWGLWGFLAKLSVVKIGAQATFWAGLPVIISIVIYLLLSSQLLPLKMNPQGIGIALLAGLSSGIATILFYFLLGKHPAGFLVAATALYPLVTILLSFFFLKEPLTATKVAGFFFALLALLLLNL